MKESWREGERGREEVDGREKRKRGGGKGKEEERKWGERIEE